MASDVRDLIARLLHDDPACCGRVTVGTITEIAALVADATAIERERCAEVAEDELCEIFEDSPEIDSVCNMVVREIAAAIRKGPTP